MRRIYSIIFQQYMQENLSVIIKYELLLNINYLIERYRKTSQVEYRKNIEVIIIS